MLLTTSTKPAGKIFHCYAHVHLSFRLRVDFRRHTRGISVFTGFWLVAERVVRQTRTSRTISCAPFPLLLSAESEAFPSQQHFVAAPSGVCRSLRPVSVQSPSRLDCRLESDQMRWKERARPVISAICAQPKRRTCGRT
jgi:hypothetical protein